MLSFLLLIRNCTRGWAWWCIHTYIWVPELWGKRQAGYRTSVVYPREFQESWYNTGRPSLKEEIMRKREHKSLMARTWRYSSIGKMLDGMPETLGLIPSSAEARHGITVLQSYHWEGRERQDEDQEFKPRLGYMSPWGRGGREEQKN